MPTFIQISQPRTPAGLALLVGVAASLKLTVCWSRPWSARGSSRAAARVVVLGHESYYPRFGFAPASRWNLTGEYGDSDAFQFLPLTAAADALRGGHIRYAPEFDEIIFHRTLPTDF